MSKKIYILDTTLRDGEQSPGCSMHLNEKLDMAEALDKLGVDIIEAGFPASTDGEFNAVKEIAKIVKNSSVAGLCRCVKSDIDKTYEAIKDAVKPRIHIFIATSPIHLKHKLNITEDRCLEIIDEYTKYAKSLVNDVQFSFEDASRTPMEFLAKATKVAIDAGATTINIPDTTGYVSPTEMANIVKYLIENVEGIDKVHISLHCHNDLGMAVANTLAGIKAGATQFEGTINGIGERAGNAAIEEVVMALKTRKDIYDTYTSIDTKRIYKTSKLLSSIIGVKVSPNKPIVGKNAFLHESGIHQHGIIQDKATYEILNPDEIGIPKSTLVFGKHSGKHAFKELIDEMGYELSDEEIDKFFPLFKDIADKKKEITHADVEFILARFTRRLINRIFALEDYEITTYKNAATATITLTTNGKSVSEKNSGDGPIDAAFKAISSITGQNFKLVDYQVHSVTEGKDAFGEAMVKLTNGITIMTGKGASTDVLEASLRAYVDATNKLLQYEE